MDDVSVRDWAGIVFKLDRVCDYLYFSYVCPQWRDVAFETNLEHKTNMDVLKASRKKLPMLMFKTEEHSDECRSLYDVCCGKTYPVKLPLPHKFNRFVGSSLGRLFCLDHDMVVTLMNPYNNGCISLPPVVEDPKRWIRSYSRRDFDMYIRKGVLLSDPCANPNSFWGQFGLFKSGEDSWTFIDPTVNIRESIFYKGKLYGACKRGELVEFDFCKKSMKTIAPLTDFMSDYVYLMESQNGELLLVKRSWHEDDYYGNDPNYGAHHSDNEESLEDCILDVSRRDWAGIPAHVMDLIVYKLYRLRDYLCFSCVCPEWRDVAFETNLEYKVNLDVLKASRNKLPMLMFRSEEHSDECRSLYDVCSRKTYPVKLPLPHKYRFVGSSFGWLFCLDLAMAVTLMNPYNKGCISLPPLVEDTKRWFRNHRRSEFDMYARKGILLSDPYECPNSFVAVVLVGIMGKFAFFKSGGDSWTFIEPTVIIDDIIFYKGKLYGACRQGELVEFDFGTESMKTIIPPTDFMSTCVYLVESLHGELLFVRRSWYEDGYYPNHGAHNSDNEQSLEDEEEGSDNEENPEDEEEGSDNEENLDDIRSVNPSDSEAESMDTRDPKNWDETDLLEACFPGTFEFRVFKMVTDPKIEEEESRASWVEMKNIGEQAFFLGDNHSLSVSTTDFPGCLPNHIYFTTEQHNAWYPYYYRGPDEDSGIFNLENGMIQKHHVLDSPKNKYVQPPIWLVPNPWA